MQRVTRTVSKHPGDRVKGLGLGNQDLSINKGMPTSTISIIMNMIVNVGSQKGQVVAVGAQC